MPDKRRIFAPGDMGSTEPEDAVSSAENMDEGAVDSTGEADAVAAFMASAMGNVKVSDDESEADETEDAENDTAEEQEENSTKSDEGDKSSGIAIGGSQPAFTLMDVDEDSNHFAEQWEPTMNTPDYIGESEMLLQYLKRQERLHKVTMPIKACGVDPIVFNNIKYATDEDGTTSTLFEIDSGDGEGSNSFYELISVDGELYLSCVTECLDREYFDRIIADATAAVKETGEYIFKMVGYRKLALEAGEKTARLLSTLRLNSFEMSWLVNYMSRFKNIEITFETIKNNQCIKFALK